MKPLLLAGFLAVSDFALAEAIVPPPFDPGRYSESLARSPFVLATKPVESPIVEGPSPFKDLYLRLVSKNSDGNYYVLFQQLGKEKAIHLEGNVPGEDGFVIKDVKIGDGFRTTRVMLQKGSDTGEIGFKEESITAPPAPIPNRAVPGGPRFPGAPPTPVRVPSPPATTTANPRPQFPQPATGNGSLNQLPPATPRTSPGEANRRQRVRVIPEGASSGR